MEPGWKFDDVALYSHTPKGCATTFAERLKARLPGVKTIYDACACIGGNTIGFSRAGFKVWATEIDPERYSMLQHNLHLESIHDAMTKQDDCFNHFSTIDVDLIFIDAPWENGQDYKQLRRFTLDNLIFDGDRTMRDAFWNIRKNPHVKWVVLKVPLKFYEDHFKTDYWWNFRNHKYCLLNITALEEYFKK